MIEIICGAERCSLMLLEPTGETLRIRASRGIDPQIVAEAVATVGTGIAGTVAQSGQPLFVADIETDSRFGRRNATQYSNTSLVCVPILVADRVVGVLNVNNKHSGASFDENDLNLMTLLASQAAVAIDNANRYEDMSERATRDGLTGVHSRGYFDDCLERAWRSAQSAGRTFSLLMLDLDHFKSVNDRYGHPAGDAVLREVARHLVIAVRDDDLVARYGGEEFSVILSRAEAAAALQVAERIRTSIEAMQAVHEGQVIQITASVGVATFQEGCLSAAQILNAADQALYQAKSTGRNRVVLAAAETA
ncbi:MAG: sensor domain-containing diguanylate cyclase [Armatimonadetes bacterium]|nr:sensor domain-containing diguanylate cyclase [Armatimonadota bacterium]